MPYVIKKKVLFCYLDVTDMEAFFQCWARGESSDVTLVMVIREICRCSSIAQIFLKTFSMKSLLQNRIGNCTDLPQKTTSIRDLRTLRVIFMARRTSAMKSLTVRVSIAITTRLVRLRQARASSFSLLKTRRTGTRSRCSQTQLLSSIIAVLKLEIDPARRTRYY